VGGTLGKYGANVAAFVPAPAPLCERGTRLVLGRFSGVARKLELWSNGSQAGKAIKADGFLGLVVFGDALRVFSFA
jgi:hypothetical protein